MRLIIWILHILIKENETPFGIILCLKYILPYFMVGYVCYYYGIIINMKIGVCNINLYKKIKKEDEMKNLDENVINTDEDNNNNNNLNEGVEFENEEFEESENENNNENNNNNNEINNNNNNDDNNNNNNKLKNDDDLIFVNYKLN